MDHQVLSARDLIEDLENVFNCQLQAAPWLVLGYYICRECFSPCIQTSFDVLYAFELVLHICHHVHHNLRIVSKPTYHIDRFGPR